FRGRPARGPAVHGLGARHARRSGPRAARRGASGRAVRPARATRPGPAPRRRGTAAGRAPRRGDPAAAPQRAGGDAGGTERPARLPGAPGGDRERPGGVPASADPVDPEPEHRGAAPAGRIRVPARPAPPATWLAEVPAAAAAGRDRGGPGGRRPGSALRIGAVEAVFLCRRPQRRALRPVLLVPLADVPPDGARPDRALADGGRTGLGSAEDQGPDLRRIR